MQQLRRKNQQLSPEDTIAIFHKGTSGVLALMGADGYPYAVPMSYVYHEGKIFFHCGKNGHKIDAIRHNPKASFCVIGQDEIKPEEYTTYYTSAIAFGCVHVIEDDREKWAAITRLCEKYYPAATAEMHKTAVAKDFAPMCMLELTVEHMSGKEALELAKARQ